MKPSTLAAPETARAEGLGARGMALACAALAAAAFYFPWRLGALNADAPLLSAMVYGAELFSFALLCLALLGGARIVRRTPQPVSADMAADILVLVSRQQPATVRRSLAAAVNVRGAGRVILVGGGEPAYALAAAFGVQHVASRREALAACSAECVALVSAGHAPHVDFLERTLGYFSDPGVAFAQGALDFALPKRPLWAEILLGAAPMSVAAQQGRDGAGAVLLGGSCALLRRSALEQIRGFASGEAWALRTGLRLHKAGLAGVFHAESLAAAVTGNGEATRAAPFARAAAAAWRSEGLVLACGLGFGQRLAYLAAFLRIADTPRCALFVALPALALMAGALPVAALDAALLAHFLPYAVLATALAIALRCEPGDWRKLFTFATRAKKTPPPLGVAERPRDVPATRKTPPAGEAELWLWAALGVAVFALAAGVTRFVVAARPPLLVLIVAGLWMLACFFLALAALATERRRRLDRRGDARLAVDFPVELHLPAGGWRAVHALDASPDGVRLAAPLGIEIAVGQKIEAYLRVAGARAPVTLRVRYRETTWEEEGAQRLELGCALIWASAGDQDFLTLALYGGAAAPALFCNENEPAALLQDESAA
jgi:hypothetical protein